MIDFQRLSDFTGGWFIGNFEPSLLKTDQFEVAVKKHPANEDWPEHYHKEATEYNVLISGEMSVTHNGRRTWLHTGDVFTILPGQIIKPYFETDCTIVTVKVPCVPGDKYVVHKSQGEHGGEESGSGE